MSWSESWVSSRSASRIARSACIPALVFGVLMGYCARLTAGPADRSRLVSPDSPGHCSKPIWSKDGKNLAYERSFPNESRIELLVLAEPTGPKPSERRVRPGGLSDKASLAEGFGVKSSPAQGDVCKEIAWGPARFPDSFMYACNVEGAVYQLFYRPSEERLDAGQQVTPGPGAAGQPAFAPTGWQLAFMAQQDGREGIFLVPDFANATDENGQLRRGAATRLLPESRRFDRMPLWDPAGKSLAFVGHSSETGSDIFVVRDVKRPAETLLRITSWSDEETAPSWSPDGTKVAFYSNRNHARDVAQGVKRVDRGGGHLAGYGLYVFDFAVGGEPYLLVDDVITGEGRGPTWSPDSRWIIYVKDIQKGNDVTDPIRAVEAKPGAKEKMLMTGTKSNQDPDVIERNGEWWMAFTSIGVIRGTTHQWRRVYLFSLSELREDKVPFATP